MTEFRPPLRSSKVPVVLAAVILPVMLVAVAALGAIALGSNQVSYAIEGGMLTVDTGLLLDSKRTFAVASVTDARVVDVRGGARTRGTGAPGLCTGMWWYPGIGSVWQATDCSSHVVLLTVAGEPQPVLISPPDPDGFIEQLHAGTDTRIVLPPGSATLLRVVPALGALVALVSLGMLGLLLFGGAKRMRYVVEGGELTIETVFSRRTFSTSELRARLHVPSVGLRLMGTAFPGYYTGLFRVDGVTTRVYATQIREPGVLLEGPARVFLSPADPAAFLDALARAGSFVERRPPGA
jgi:hypothetical protein